MPLHRRVVHFLLNALFFFKGAQAYNIDNTRYEEGKRQFEVLQKNCMLPNYGLCWTNCMIALRSGCKQLTDIEQSRLALSFLNCFLLVQGRKHYKCDQFDDIKTCTQTMTGADSASYATFFIHTHNICYFLEAQVWHENTERTINLLSSSSAEVADQLEKSSHLQQEVLKQQKLSLQNQNVMLDQASNLSAFIIACSNNIHDMFTEFQQSTSKQYQIINDMFDRLKQLQSTVLGEFLWFYSYVYYVLSIVMCYMLTSTPRTNGVRLWLFLLMTLSAVCEYLLQVDGYFSNQSEDVYRRRWFCRKCFAGAGCFVWLYYAFRWQDINTLNNKLLNENNRLLNEIKSQNDKLRMCLRGKQKKKPHPVNRKTSGSSVDELKFDSHSLGTDIANPQAEIEQILTFVVLDTSLHTLGKQSRPRSEGSLRRPLIRATGYESGSSGDESHELEPGSHDLDPNPRHSQSQSRTPRQPPSDTDDQDSVSSYSTALTTRSEVTQVSTRSVGRSSSLHDELQDLHNTTPFKDLFGNLINWATFGKYSLSLQERPTDTEQPETNGRDRPVKTSQDSKGQVATHRYGLRQRKPR